MKEIKDQKDFNNTLKNNKKVIVKFTADWCGPCRMLTPIYDEVSKNQNSKDVLFTQLNIDKLEEIAKDNKIGSIPTMIVFENAKEIKRHTGIMQKEDLENFIK